MPRDNDLYRDIVTVVTVRRSSAVSVSPLTACRSGFYPLTGVPPEPEFHLRADFLPVNAEFGVVLQYNWRRMSMAYPHNFEL